MDSLKPLCVLALAQAGTLYAVRQKVYAAAMLLGTQPTQVVQTVSSFSDVGRALFERTKPQELRFWLDQNMGERLMHIDWVLAPGYAPPRQLLDWLPMQNWRQQEEHWVLRQTSRFIGNPLSSAAVQTLVQTLEAKTREELFDDLNAKNSLLQMEIEERKATEENLRLTQEELISSEKLAALGALVAGIAHEINTPVGIGVTAASHLTESVSDFRKTYESGKMRRSDLESFLDSVQKLNGMVEENLHRASSLIRSFKEVAVDQTADDEREILLKDYANQVVISLSPVLRNRPVRVDTEGIDPQLRLRTSPGPISQILTNFIVNSLIHGFDPEQAGTIGISARADGSDLKIVYTDNGKGIAPEHLKKIFDPFFTTKRGSGGSGLGMHLVYNIATKKYGGTIRCDSSPGHGVRFELSLPKMIAS